MTGTFFSYDLHKSVTFQLVTGWAKELFGNRLTTPGRYLTFRKRLNPSKSCARRILRGDSGAVSKEFSCMTTQPRRRLIEVEDIGDVTVVNFTENKILDEARIQVIGDQLFQLVDELGRRKILLNFGNVEYLSSAALGKLITLNKKLQNVGGRLILCNIDSTIYEVFEITKLNKLFSMHREEQAAWQAFLQPGTAASAPPVDPIF